jgi:hypothetical protein
MTKETLYTSQEELVNTMWPVKQMEYPCNGTRRLRKELPNAFQRALRSNEPIELKY